MPGIIRKTLRNPGTAAPQGDPVTRRRPYWQRGRTLAGRTLARALAVVAIWCTISITHAADASRARTILVYGDSLSAAYGLREREGWVTLLAERLKQERLDYTVTNASISGETSAGGASRIERTLEKSHPQWLILVLGSNDGLRGLPIAQMKANLATIVRAAQRRGARVLVVGNQMPPNYGSAYTTAFAAAFAELGREFNIPVVPFLLAPIAAQRDYFQPDNLHPTAAAQPLILDHLWGVLKPLISK